VLHTENETSMADFTVRAQPAHSISTVRLQPQPKRYLNLTNTEIMCQRFPYGKLVPVCRLLKIMSDPGQSLQKILILIISVSLCHEFQTKTIVIQTNQLLLEPSNNNNRNHGLSNPTVITLFSAPLEVF
jgi:hypothetical protein